MSKDRDIREAIMQSWDSTYDLARRPELTDVERERLRVAADIILETQFQVRKRFLTAEPNTTTFSVLGQ